MTNMTKSAAAERIHNLACAANVILRTKQAGCCGRKPSKKKSKRKCASMSKAASRDFMRKLACAVAVVQRARGIQKSAAYEEAKKDRTPLWKNPLAIGGAGGAVIGGSLGAALGPKGKRFLSMLVGTGIGTGVGVGAGYGYTKLKKDDKKEQSTPASSASSASSAASGPYVAYEDAQRKVRERRDRLDIARTEPDSTGPGGISTVDTPVGEEYDSAYYE